MTNEVPTKIDDDALELIERRLSEKIETDICGRLFKSYLSMGAVVLAVLGYIGVNVADEVKKYAEDKFNDLFVAKYDTKMEEIKQKAVLIDVLADTTQRDALHLQAIADAAKPQIALVETYADQVQDLNSKTKDLHDGFLIPGIDFETSVAGLNEVRYYYDSDRPTAATLADAATRALQTEIPGAPTVTIRSLTNWPNSKPIPGTLELWLGGPDTAAAVPAQ